MTLKKTLARHGLNTLTILAAIIVVIFGILEPGNTMAKELLENNPVLFYSIFVPIASIFGIWIITQAKKRLK